MGASASRKPAAGAAATGAPSPSAAGAELDLTGIDQDLARFQQDELVRQALGRGVELKGYAAQIEQELKEVRWVKVGGSGGFIGLSWVGWGWWVGLDASVASTAGVRRACMCMYVHPSDAQQHPTTNPPP